MLVFFTLAFQIQLSAIHASENTVTLTIRASNSTQAFIETNDKMPVCTGLKKVKRRFHSTLISRIVSKISGVVSKRKPPKKVKDFGNGMAVASLVLGVAGMALLFSLPIIGVMSLLLAFIFGVISFIRYEEGYHDRKWLALSGLILGAIGISIVLFLALVLLPFWLFL